MIHEYVQWAGRHVPRRPALVDPASGLSVTYAALDGWVSRLAGVLHEQGLRPGDRVGLLMETSPEHLALYLAVARLKAVVVPVNSYLGAGEVAYLLDDANAAFLLHDAQHAEVAMSAAAGLDITLLEQDGWAEFTSDRRPAPTTGSHRRTSPSTVLPDLVVLGYTSGTTGFPKAAMLTNASIGFVNRSNAIGYRLPLGSCGVYGGDMSFTASVPAFMLTHLCVAGTVVFAPSRHPEDVVEALVRHHGTYAAVPPPLVGEMADVCERRRDELGPLRGMLQAAGPARWEDVVRLNHALDGRLLTGWGMTENSGGLVTALSADASRRALAEPELLRSVGEPLPGFEVRVDAVTDEASDTEAGVGELSVRGPSLMAGYWNRPEETTAVFEDGWYRTGDLGRLTDDGHVILVDRRADLIVSGGMNVYPSEVERVIAELPWVRECAVVGMPHPRWGRAVAAFVVGGQGRDRSAEVLAHCQQRLASFKKPLRIELLEHLPRTVGGKIRRTELERRLATSVAD